MDTAGGTCRCGPPGSDPSPLSRRTSGTYTPGEGRRERERDMLPWCFATVCFTMVLVAVVCVTMVLVAMVCVTVVNWSRAHLAYVGHLSRSVEVLHVLKEDGLTGKRPLTDLTLTCAHTRKREKEREREREREIGRAHV